MFAEVARARGVLSALDAWRAREQPGRTYVITRSVSSWLLGTDSCVLHHFLFLSPGVLVPATAARAVCWMSQLWDWCVDQDHGKDDVTGETLVRRDDDQPEVSYISSVPQLEIHACISEPHPVCHGYLSHSNGCLILLLSCSLELVVDERPGQA